MSKIGTLAAAGVLATLVVGGTAPAQADGGDVVRRGDCTGRTDWKVKVGPEDGRLEVEGPLLLP
jgi:hypothetical protein